MLHEQPGRDGLRDELRRQRRRLARGTGAPDFAQWVWQQAGANTNGLDAAAQSFYDYGQNNGTLSNSPSAGDAVVFDNGSGIHHACAIVVQVVNSDNGTIETVSGDWDGQSGSESEFSSTSSVVLEKRPRLRRRLVGSGAGDHGDEDRGVHLARPRRRAGSPTAPSCVVTTTGEQGTCIDTSTCASMGGTLDGGLPRPGAASIECCTRIWTASASEERGHGRLGGRFQFTRPRLHACAPPRSPSSPGPRRTRPHAAERRTHLDRMLVRGDPPRSWPLARPPVAAAARRSMSTIGSGAAELLAKPSRGCRRGCRWPGRERVPRRHVVRRGILRRRD